VLTRRNLLKMGGVSVAALGLGNCAYSDEEQTPELNLENMVGGVTPLAPEDFELRMEKARRLMAEHDIDGLFLTGSTNLRYFTNIQWGRTERTFGAVLNRRGDPIWVCPGLERDSAQEHLSAAHEVRIWEEHESPFALIENIMRELGGRRLGLGPTIRNFVANGLRNDAPRLELVDGSVVTENCRVIKTEKELGYMELASRITKLALKETFAHLHDGMTAGEIASIASAAHRQMGVSGFGNPKIGQNSSFPHGSSVERTVAPGTIVLTSGGSSIEGFNCDVDRTTVFGTPTDEQKRIFDVVKEAQLAALASVRPGVTCESVDTAGRKVIEDAGFGPEYTYFKHRIGHGVGMDGHEYTYLVQGNKVKLEPGMVFSCEPAIYIEGDLGIRIEDDFVVTEDGARRLGGMFATGLNTPFGD
jgi:Xaa-Pro dipeptidase